MRATRFEQAPARVYWELTRACDLACRHCRAEAMPERASDELTTRECERVLRELASAGPPTPHVVFTGGDPLKRPGISVQRRAHQPHRFTVTPPLTGPLIRPVDAGCGR